MTTPIYSIKDYVWRLLKQEQAWTTINGLIPVIPVDQQPEFKDQRLPYITYASNRETGRSNDYWRPTESAGFTIHAPTVAKVNDAISTLSEALGQFDRRAEFVNMSGAHASNPAKATLSKIFLTNVQVTSTSFGNPSDEEGGMATGYISIRYSFTQADKNYKITF